MKLNRKLPRIRRAKPDTEGRQQELDVYTDVEIAAIHYGLLVERLGLLSRATTRSQERQAVMAWLQVPLGPDDQARPFSFHACLLWWNAGQAPGDQVDPAAFQALILDCARRWEKRFPARADAGGRFRHAA